MDVTPLRALDTGLLQDWQRLSDAAVERNPFFAPRMLVPAVRWLPGAQETGLLTVRRSDRLVLAMPVRRRRYGHMPFRALATWSHPYRYLGTPLVQRDALEDAPGAALAALTRRGFPGWLVLDQVYVQEPVSAAFRAAAIGLSVKWTEQDVWDRPTVRRRPQETYLNDTLSAKSAKTLRRLRRGLERDHGAVHAVDQARDGSPDTIEEAIEAFLQLEVSGWKGKAGTALASDPRHAQFFRATCRALAAHDQLELWQLKVGGRVAAAQCHIRDGDQVFHWKTAYDEEFARSSPGVQLELEVLHAFHADRTLQLLDPCTDNEPGTSTRLYPDARRLGTLLIGVDPLGEAAVRAAPWLTDHWRRVKVGARAARGAMREGWRSLRQGET